jgi:multidrug efflux pump subunit AcrA (membrane-fusion protein)
LVAAGSPVLVLGAQDRGFVVRAGLADRDIVQIKLGDLAQIQLDAMPDVKLQGRVAEVASGAEPGSGMFMVEVALDSANLPLKSGLVAKLEIVPASATVSERVYIPISAIVEGNGRDASVFVLGQEHSQKHKVQRRAVQVAFIDRESVALASGVKAGEQVITDGALYLEDGEQVAVQEAG